VVVIPAHLADEIADEADRDDRLRGLRDRGSPEGRSIIGLYPATKEESKADFARWRQAKGR
jgi:regulator of RNase E activity RraA